MTSPLISIVTPSYQQHAFIEETLLSVKGQSYENVEHIVIDGLSTDGTQEILAKYQSLYNLNWISEKDSGQSEAINKGFCRSKGDIIGWVNSDDTYLPETLNKVVKCFASNPDVNWVYGDAYWIDKHGNVIGIYQARDFDLAMLAYEGMYIPQPTIFVRKTLLDSIGFLDNSYHTTMDYDFCLRLGLKCSGKYIRDVLATRRIHAETKMAIRQADLYYDALACLDKLYARTDLPNELLAIKERVYGNRHRVGGYRLFSAGRYNDARDTLLRALRSKNPFSLYELASISILLLQATMHVNWIKPGLSFRRSNKKYRKVYNGLNASWGELRKRNGE